MVSSFTLISTKCLGGPGPDRNRNRVLEHHLSGEDWCCFLIPSYRPCETASGSHFGSGSNFISSPTRRVTYKNVTKICSAWVGIAAHSHLGSVRNESIRNPSVDALFWYRKQSWLEPFWAQMHVFVFKTYSSLGCGPYVLTHPHIEQLYDVICTDLLLTEYQMWFCLLTTQWWLLKLQESLCLLKPWFPS